MLQFPYGHFDISKTNVRKEISMFSITQHYFMWLQLFKVYSVITDWNFLNFFKNRL